MLVGIGYIYFTEPSLTLNCKLFLKHCILQTNLHVFLLFIFLWNKIFYSKNRRILHFLIRFGMAFDVEVLNEMFGVFGALLGFLVFGVSGALKDFLATGDMSCWE